MRNQLLRLCGLTCIPPLLLCAVFACSDPDEQPVSLIDAGVIDADDEVASDTDPTDATDGGTEAGTETGDVSDADVDGAWSDPDENEYAGPDAFEKPDRDPTLAEREFWDEDDFDSMGGSGTFRLYAREHMRRQGYSREMWLYRDEHFVMDIVHARYSPSTLPLNYELAVVHQGEHLPFRYVEVNSDDDWPSMEEIESWEEEHYGYSDSFHLKNGVPENMTIVVPPHAFPEKGAYNITLMFQPAWEPDPDRFMLRQAMTYYLTYTAYVGSELFLNDGGHIPRGEDFAQEIDATQLDLAVDRTQGNFLAPSTDVYDWKATDDPEERELGVVLETDEAQVTLELHTTGFQFLSFDNRHLDTLYYVLQDFEVVDQFVLNPDFGMHPGGWPVEDGKGYVVPIDVELPEDEVTFFQVVGIPNPFKRHDEDHRRRGVDSNGLLLRYSP